MGALVVLIGALAIGTAVIEGSAEMVDRMREWRIDRKLIKGKAHKPRNGCE